ncbi:hypothetical protein SAMN05421810_11399 [Amycolatopsis arida]|uniref:Uncharacterized protein n=1 Tax=Amycolatopsis arida TaxID=587909 RepID=A0A1I6AMT9_9PSEU|nr:hypothetical protein [Amycolatopsis arida]TDX87416.1 hypothetical protein CLV69_11399 [Amycolatopsis arida]SFQ70003.1 hypothetical protein SAMN05421810_11399 [Amycolatopsis arida]
MTQQDAVTVGIPMLSPIAATKKRERLADIHLAFGIAVVFTLGSALLIWRRLRVES